jgi:hypothetical protein
MNRYLKLVSICIISVAVLYAQKGIQPDSSFKSIHRLELEQHQKDTSQHDTTVKIKTALPESTVTPEIKVKAVINLSLLIVVTIVLIVAIAIYFIVRSMSRSQRE